jgi:hypothetical protein
MDAEADSIQGYLREICLTDRGLCLDPKPHADEQATACESSEHRVIHSTFSSFPVFFARHFSFIRRWHKETYDHLAFAFPSHLLHEHGTGYAGMREAKLRQGDVVGQFLEDDFDAPPDLGLGIGCFQEVAGEQRTGRIVELDNDAAGQLE